MGNRPPSSELTQVVSCGGGLDLISDPITMFNKMGFATTLVNFESSQTGGYRRIDGYSYAAPVITTPSGATNKKMLGIARYSGGVIASQNTGIYKTTDFYTWTSLGVTKDATKRDVITYYRTPTDHEILLFSNGVGNVVHIEIVSGVFTVTTLGTSTGCPSNPLWATMYKERYVVSQGSTVYWSGRFTPNDFTTSSAGAVDVGDTITGVKAFRDTLFIFCTNSIHTITTIDENPTRQQIAKNIGCISGWSIQEVNGDIVFLARDGLRTVAATDKIGDVALSTQTFIIYPLISAVCDAIDEYDISSVVIRSKNQYRMFYNDPLKPSERQRGIIGSVVLTAENGIRWEWSETKGIEAVYISSEEDANTIEKVYHGDYRGYIYNHIDGASFNGDPVYAVYKTPDISFGDAGIRKTIYSVTLSVRPESLSNINMTLRYNFSEKGLTQPSTYSFRSVSPAAIYASGIYGESVYGANTLPLIRVNVEGSGTSCSFKFEVNDATSLFKINGFYVDLQPNGRND